MIKPSKKEIFVNKLYSVFIVLLFSAFVVGYTIINKPEPEPKAEPKTIEQIKKSVVRIRAENQMSGEKREGTGFVVGVSNDKAYIITVSHVVAGDPNPKVTFFENNEFKAEILNSESQENGLTLLSVKGEIPYDIMPLYLVKGRNLNIGDTVFTFGFPRGEAPWLHDKLSYSAQKMRNLLFSDSDVKEGNSGSPIIKGEQVVAVITSVTDFAYGISAETVRYFLLGATGGETILNEMEKWDIATWRKEYEARSIAAIQIAAIKEAESLVEQNQIVVDKILDKYAKTWETQAIRGDAASYQKQWKKAALFFRESLDLTKIAPQQLDYKEIKKIYDSLEDAQVFAGEIVSSLVPPLRDPAKSLWVTPKIRIAVEFKNGGWKVSETTQKGKKAIKRIADYLNAHNVEKITLTGHTDERGKRSYNQWLSEQQAKSVAAYLQNFGVQTRIKTRGKGEDEPLPLPRWKNLTQEEIYQRNRRVEIEINK
jgi:outer membrane protein OmpA-like peptidoglycan-associated protein